MVGHDLKKRAAAPEPALLAADEELARRLHEELNANAARVSRRAAAQQHQQQQHQQQHPPQHAQREKGGADAGRKPAGAGAQKKRRAQGAAAGAGPAKQRRRWSGSGGDAGGGSGGSSGPDAGGSDGDDDDYRGPSSSDGESDAGGAGGGGGSGAGEAPPASAVLVSYPDQCSCVVADLLGVPLVEANGNPWVQGPIWVPQFMSGLTPAMLRSSWLARIRNAARWAMMQALPLATPRAAWRALRSEAGLGPSTPATCAPLEPRARLVSMEIEFKRPVPEGQVAVGSIAPRPGGPITDGDLADFVGGATGGLVLAGFGSTPVYGRSLGPQDFVQLAKAFASLASLQIPGAGPGGVRVLWGVREAALPEGLALADLPLGPNTRVVSWYPDNDVLAHPNTKAFVSHFGLHSLYGGVFHGVPLVGLPFTAEQLDNARKGEALGLSATCPQAPAFAPRGRPRCGEGGRGGERAAAREEGCVVIQADAVVDCIKEVLLNGSYARAAAAVSRTMAARYRIRPPLLRAADEVELALLAAAARASLAA